MKNVERKVTWIGNSLGVTLPQEVLDHIKVKHGDEIKFVLEPDGKVTIKKYVPVNFDVLDEFDRDFLEGVKDLFDNYDNTLRRLADR